ncbi:MAG: RteC domain-containing protein [Prolixibacteraceae bacterium]
MKSIKLQNFLKLHLKANAIVISNPKVCDLITFNNVITKDKYKQFLEKKNHEASSIHLKALMKSNGDGKNYLSFLQKQFSDAMSEFTEKDGYLIHKSMAIKDLQENTFCFDELSSEVKSKISTFISLQKSSLMCFLSKLDLSENQLLGSSLKWNGTNIDFIELGNALFEGAFIISESGPITKKEFMKQFSKLLNIDPGAWEITLNKAMARENPAKFIDKLKATILKYYSNLINI